MLAECLIELFHGEDSIEAQAAAFRLAEFINVSVDSLTKKR